MIVFVVYTALLVVPGLLLGATLGLRGWTLAATAPLATYAIVAAVGTLCALTGLPWGWPTFLLASAVLVGLAVAARRRFPRLDRVPGDDGGQPWPGWRSPAVIAAAVIGSGIGALVLARATGWLEVPPQDWDAQFHANAIRYIADTGDADPAALAAINRYDYPAGFYYPNGWHLLGALVYRITGAPIPVVFDASIVLVAPLLTVGLVGLLRRFRARPALAVNVAVLSCAASAIPYDLIRRGPLITYATAVVLVPAFLILLHRAVADRSVPAALLTAASAAALLVIHPGGAFVAAIFAAALIAERWLLDHAALRRDLPMLGITCGVAVVLSAPAVLGSFNSVAESSMFLWPADQSAAAAVGELMGFSHLSQFPRWSLAIPLVIGLMLLRGLRPLWWLLAGSLVFGVLFVLTASYGGPLVAQLTRPWWGDKWRLIAVFTIGAVVLAAHGLVVISDAIRSRLRTPLVPALVLGLVAVASGGFYQQDDDERVRFAMFSDGPGLSNLERQGIEALARLVPPGAMVMNQNSDGSAWMYALTGIRPVNGHVEVQRLDAGQDLSRYVISTPGPPGELPSATPEVFRMSDTQMLLHKRFNHLDTDPQVRSAVSRLNVQYVFLGRGYVRSWFRRADGLRDLDQVRSLQLVYENPDVRIYRVLPQPRVDTD